MAGELQDPLTVQTSTGLQAAAADTAGALYLNRGPVGTLLNFYENQLVANGTTTVTATTSYLATLVISISATGTTSTITVQDGQATPVILVDGLATTALSTAPTVIALPFPIKMTSGIKIVTAGAVAATVNIWANYFA